MKITTVGWWGAYPDANAATAGYLLQSEGVKILLDCGSGVLSHLQNYLKLQELDAVVLSHYHWDHIADVGCLQYAARILMDLGQRLKPLPIYGHAEDENFYGLDYLDYSKGFAIDPHTSLKLDHLTFRFCRNVHPDPSFSIRVDAAACSLVYMTDTGWTEDLIEFAQGADLLICESSLYDEYRGRIPGHLTAGEAGQIAAAAGARHLVLTHLPHFGDHAMLLKQAAAKFGGKIELATTGKVWQL